MVFKHMKDCGGHFHGFENDVKMYGIQTTSIAVDEAMQFENDVKMYGIQTQSK